MPCFFCSYIPDARDVILNIFIIALDIWQGSAKHPKHTHSGSMNSHQIERRKMNNRRLQNVLPLFAALLFSFGQSAAAQLSIELTPVKDNTLFESGTGHLSNGVGAGLFVGKTNNNLLRRGLLTFDIASAIPPAAVIESVRLTMHMAQTSTGARTVSVHRVLTDWGEGTSNSTVGGGGQGAPATTGDATWIHTFFDTATWQNAGGDFDDTASASMMIGIIGTYTWNSTPRLVNDVRDWLERPDENFGWLLRGDEEAQGTAKRFDSRESLTSAFIPKLHIIYSIATDVETESLPTAVRLLSSFPNPFQHTTTISYELATPEFVTLDVYDVLGRTVQKLVASRQNIGLHQVIFDGTGLPGGIYFYRLSASGAEQIGKMVLQR